MERGQGGLEELHLFATLMTESLVEPYEFPYQQTSSTIIIIDGAAPLVDQLNELERFKVSLLASLRGSLTVPTSPDWPHLPYVSLSLEAKDERHQYLHWLRLAVKPDVEQGGVWLATHATDRWEEKLAVRTSIEDVVHFAGVVLLGLPNKWVTEVSFESPASAPRRKSQGGRSRRPR
ncbi:hypothetical protein ACFL2T_04225 [Elusimicrobiota bacterium]